MTAILMIEDNPDLLAIVGNVLTTHGFEVMLAPDGTTGLERAQEEAPALILCDLNLPDMNGYEVLTELRLQPSTARTPVVFVTGDHYCAPPVDDNVQVLEKPFNIEALLKLMPSSV